MHEGQAQLGPLAGPAPAQGGAQDAPVIGYVRPHDLEIARSRNGAATVEATVRHIYAAGPLVRLDLERHDTGGLIAAELTRERHQELALKVGEDVHVKPRNVRVFLNPKEVQPEDYSI